jgi:hypothetical protein
VLRGLASDGPFSSPAAKKKFTTEITENTEEMRAKTVNKQGAITL